jgi:hypothetical protein
MVRASILLLWATFRLFLGQLRPIAPSYLNTILELLLNYLVVLSLSHEAADVEMLTDALTNDHDIPSQVSCQIMTWFGELTEGKWEMDVNAVIKEVGLGILSNYKVLSFLLFTSLTLINQSPVGPSNRGRRVYFSMEISC